MTDSFTPTESTVVSASFFWRVRPPAALASGVRELLSCIHEGLLEPDVNDSVAMAAHELLENIVKYSAGGASQFDIEIGDAGGGRSFVRLRTSNAAAPDHLDGLTRLIDRIAGAADPLAVYDELIAGSARRKGSGLGLARIRAEADMLLSYAVAGGQIAITAERPVTIRSIGS